MKITGVKNLEMSEKFCNQKVKDLHTSENSKVQLSIVFFYKYLNVSIAILWKHN